MFETRDLLAQHNNARHPGMPLREIKRCEYVNKEQEVKVEGMRRMKSVEAIKLKHKEDRGTIKGQSRGDESAA